MSRPRLSRTNLLALGLLGTGNTFEVIQKLAGHTFIGAAHAWLGPLAIAATTLSNIGSNLIASSIEKKNHVREAARNLLTNRDIALSQAVAIQARLLQMSPFIHDSKQRERLERIAQEAHNWWLALVHNPLREELDPFRDAQFLEKFAEQLAGRRPLLIDQITWEELLREADSTLDQTGRLEDGWITWSASKLATDLGQDFVEAIKSDFEFNGKSYAAISLRFFAEILLEVRGVAANQGELSRQTRQALEGLLKVLPGLDKVLAQLADVAALLQKLNQLPADIKSQLADTENRIFSQLDRIEDKLDALRKEVERALKQIAVREPESVSPRPFRSKGQDTKLFVSPGEIGDSVHPTTQADVHPVAVKENERRVQRLRFARRYCIFGLMVWMIGVIVGYAPPRTVSQGDLGRLLHHNCWICYDPSGLRQTTNGIFLYPTLTSIGQDLDVIKTAGFSGIVTFGSTDTLAEVPQLAKERGLAVIMGVWNPNNQMEVRTAIRQAKYVDGYCIGHNGLKKDYSISELKTTVLRVQRETKLPVTTTEWALRYETQLAGLGDWLFPDVHIPVRSTPNDKPKVDVERDVKLFVAALKQMAEHARQQHKLLVLKCIAYPHSGIEGASPTNQALFFNTVLNRLEDTQEGLPVTVSIAPMSAFDAPWKKGRPYFEWDPYVGLLRPFESERTNNSPRISPAAQFILEHYGRIRRSEGEKTIDQKPGTVPGQE